MVLFCRLLQRLVLLLFLFNITKACWVIIQKFKMMYHRMLMDQLYISIPGHISDATMLGSCGGLDGMRQGLTQPKQE